MRLPPRSQAGPRQAAAGVDGPVPRSIAESQPREQLTIFHCGALARGCAVWQRMIPGGEEVGGRSCHDVLAERGACRGDTRKKLLVASGRLTYDKGGLRAAIRPATLVRYLERRRRRSTRTVIVTVITSTVI